MTKSARQQLNNPRAEEFLIKVRFVLRYKLLTAHQHLGGISCSQTQQKGTCMDKHQEVRLGFSKPRLHKGLKPSQSYKIKDMISTKTKKYKDQNYIQNLNQIIIFPLSFKHHVTLVCLQTSITGLSVIGQGKHLRDNW